MSASDPDLWKAVVGDVFDLFRAAIRTLLRALLFLPQLAAAAPWIAVDLIRLDSQKGGA